LNPKNAQDSVIIPIKVNIGDFHCETKDVFYITPDATGTGASYNNLSAQDIVNLQPPIVEPVDPIIAVLSSAKNIGVSQANKIKSTSDMQVYYVDTSTELGFEFSCPDSTRFTNDWSLSIYDTNKTLQNTQIINGSDCGTGQTGDNGTFTFALPKTLPRYYLAVKSACNSGDTTCAVDSSQYEIKRILPIKAPTTGTAVSTTTTTAPCFHTTCDASTTASFPVFGAN
jgi:hypothetical protein